MDVIVNGINGKGHGTFKFQYSRYAPVKNDSRFVPHNDKKLAENILGSYFCDFLRRHYNSTISEYTNNIDDSHKKPDVSFIENGKLKGMQITELQFTKHEERKALSKRIGEQLVNSIVKLFIPKYPIIVNIFPIIEKDSIPLADVKKGKGRIINELASYIASVIEESQPHFDSDASPIWHTVADEKLAKYYRQLVLNIVPRNCYPRFFGHSNVYINYDIDDVSFALEDVGYAIQEIFRRKNNGSANILLIWSDELELATFSKRKAAEKIFEQFETSTFEEVFFMSFVNNLPMFLKSLELWALKGPRTPIKVI